MHRLPGGPLPHGPHWRRYVAQQVLRARHAEPACALPHLSPHGHTPVTVGETVAVLEGFVEEVVQGDDLPLLVRHRLLPGRPGVLLLHGHPRTSATWHRVAPLLVDVGLSVVCADLPGYGRSGKPAPAPDHAPHAKTASARRLRAAMRALGQERFAVVGHDRGSYAAFRLALDHPDAVTRVALLDGIPVVEHLERCDARFAAAWWHWFFFAQPDKPERAIGADPLAWYRFDDERMGAENAAECRAAVQDPAVVRGMLEDYRAGLTVDAAEERAARDAGRRVTQPLLVLWSLRDDLEELHGDPRAIWRRWADDVDGRGIDSGHHVAEEAPEALVASLVPFLLPPG
jgi:haloacetate dehalogenase